MANDYYKYKIKFPTYKEVTEDMTVNEKKQIEYENIKQFAVYQFGDNLIKAMFLIETHLCPNGPFWNINLPKNIFRWNLADTLKTFRQVTVWYTMAIKKMFRHCLETKKILVDYDECRLLIIDAIEKYFDEEESDIMENLSEILQFFDIVETLSVSMDRKRTLLTEDFHQSLMISFIGAIRRQSQTRYIQKLMAPIQSYQFEMSFRLKYKKAIEGQTAFSCDLDERHLEKLLAEAQQHLANEVRSSECCMNYYYNEFGSLRSRIQRMTKKYDEEMAKCDEDLLHIRLYMEKTGHRKKFLTEQMAQFRLEIDEALLKEEALKMKREQEYWDELRIAYQKSLKEERKKDRAKEAKFRKAYDRNRRIKDLHLEDKMEIKNPE